MTEWAKSTPAEAGLDAAKLDEARDFALKGGGSGCIVRHGTLVFAWGDQKRLYDLKSTTKSIGVTALALAIADGKMDLADTAGRRHSTFGLPPAENRKTGWLDRITLFHLATQTAGFDKDGGYARLLFEPGTKWSYSDGGPNWLAECVTLAYKRDVADLLFERVFTPIGIGTSDLTWRTNAYRPAAIDGLPRREFGSGVSANVNAMARIGLLYLRDGRWGERQIIPASFVATARTTPAALRGLPVVRAETYGRASDHYGLLWWNNGDGALANVPRDAYWSWGLYESLIVVVPSLDLVVARVGQSFPGEWAGHYNRLAPFLEPIMAAAGGTHKSLMGAGKSNTHNRIMGATARPSTSGAPYPPSPVIAGLAWAPLDTVRRDAEGSDNWPMTWADDDALYTAYGDGNGFAEPKAPRLSLGLAKVLGGPADFKGVNLRSESAEQKGDGPSGKKASGLLMVDGVLYLLARNAKNAQLAWSADRGQTWTWADWRFTAGFGCPTFLNFGRNYAGARDHYVYIYSFDSDSAYEPADRMVLARAPKNRIRERDAYEFFVKTDADGKPVWTRDIAARGAVFEHTGRCYRSGITYCAPLKRHLWVQVAPGGDTRFAGGFGLYDAPEPWGPWTTVFFTEKWDMGPGETASFPAKWMSADGLTLHLVSSTTDHFTVRKATLTLVAPGVGVER
jgi:CubicO group peptidase (beta-lactamase class C family)